MRRKLGVNYDVFSGNGLDMSIELQPHEKCPKPTKMSITSVRVGKKITVEISYELEDK